MDDRDFFKLLLTQFEATTGAADTYWFPKEVEDTFEISEGYDILTMNKKEEKGWIGTVRNQADAEFICAVMGCFPDLVRRLEQALDEADLKDRQRDEIAHEHIELAQEHNYALARIKTLEARVAELEGASNGG
ncbi:hypothetical protein [Segniliparus rugosus]|uniref:Uncharacterized protein n=1 Tax=Segniliparus rugosus (strain ATCC BAA-974 / DSM 45345 / CCUG 50838 / CIP 108380 / JCM 13579 / CDC 945) TaxID=679197 RepID=E5XRX6_SEGRC|nr:hypothetical protein [Segniliparus rugosus]EFV12911.1 hypothetical protein HMPREF9336_02248 [Segniliparus rugosus ATCC BAA-974]